MKETRVAHFIDTFNHGGAESMVIELCRQLKEHAQRDHNEPRPVVIHFGNDYIDRECREHRIDTLIAPWHGLYKSIYTLPLFALRFARFLKKEKIAVLHSHLLGAVFAGSLAARLASTPHIGTLHDIYMLREAPSRKWLLRTAARLNTRLVTVSEEMRRFYTSEIPGLTDISTIHNGVEPPGFASDPKNCRHGEPQIPGTVTAIYTGRLTALKRHDLAIEALAKAANPSLKLLIVGEGECRKQIEEAVEKYGLGDHVTMTGHRNDIFTLLAQSDIFLITSESEGLSKSIIEAMFCCLPVICFNVGGNRELVADGDNGFVIDGLSADAVAERLALLTSDGELRQTLGRNARRKAQAEFSIQECSDKYRALYHQVLQ